MSEMKRVTAEDNAKSFIWAWKGVNREIPPTAADVDAAYKEQGTANLWCASCENRYPSVVKIGTVTEAYDGNEQDVYICDKCIARLADFLEQESEVEQVF